VTLVAVVLVPFLLALPAAWIGRRWARAGGLLLALVPACSAGVLLSLAPSALAGQGVRAAWPWVPELGVQLALRLDGLSLLFALIVTGIGALIVLYSGYYMAGKPDGGRFQAYTFLFMGSMLGVVLADDLIALFVFWELTSVTSYLLIGFHGHNERARHGALKALLITSAGGLALLLGLVLMATIGGTMRLSELLAQGDVLRQSGLYLPVLTLVLLGAFTKSAQFPFHIWLPAAMQAPTPASAYLHSATMVKAGVYLLARLQPALGGSRAWTVILTDIGLLTMVLGAYLAFKQTDVKALLAYSTVGTLGLIVGVLGLGTADAVHAAMVVVLAHALYKAALFLIVGTVDRQAGGRSLDVLGGLARRMPVSALTAVVAAMSMAGLPPLLGFIAKEEFLEAETHMDAGLALGILGPTLGILAATLGMATSVLLVRHVFFGPRRPALDHAREAPVGMLVAPGALAVASLVFAWPPLRPAVGTLLNGAASAGLGRPVDVSLVLWHGVNLPLVLSAVAVALGAALYLERWPFWRLQHRVPPGATLDRAYDLALHSVARLAAVVTRTVQTGTLRHYLLMILGTLLGLVTLALLAGAEPLRPVRIEIEPVAAYELAAAGVTIVAALAVVFMPSRLGAIAALGTVGLMMSFFFVLYSGPDLALTQLLVETLTIILLLLVFYFLPPYFEVRTPLPSRLRDVLVALGVGVMVTVLVVVVGPTKLSPTISSYYVDGSLRDAFGANMVNVILVDYRAMDTLGEITVLAIAALGVFGLIRLRMHSPCHRRHAGPGRPPDAEP